METELCRETPYEQLGGAAGLGALVEAFYARVEDDLLLRSIYPRHLTCAKRHLRQFLTEFLGGPPDYSEQRGRSLQAGHAHMQIGAAEQHAWLVAMRGALDDLRVQEPLREVFTRFFTDASASLINHPTPVTTPSPCQSLADDPAEFSTPGRDLDAELRGRWARQQVLDELRVACEADDLGRVLAFADHPLLVDHLPAQYAAAALLGCTGEPEGLAWVRARLECHPALLTARGNYGMTLLQTAAGNWATPLVELMLAHGADPNVDAYVGHSPLCVAGNRTIIARSRNQDQAQPVVAALVKAGADINAAGGVKQTAALHNAARRGTVEMAAALLAHGADLEARDSDGETPLRRAVNCGKPKVVELLLSRGADLHSRSNNGTTPGDAARTPAVLEVLQPYL